MLETLDLEMTFFVSVTGCKTFQLGIQKRPFASSSSSALKD